MRRAPQTSLAIALCLCLHATAPAQVGRSPIGEDALRQPAAFLVVPPAEPEQQAVAQDASPLVDSQLARFRAEIAATKLTEPTTDLSALSDPLRRSTADGRIQVYVYVEDVTQDMQDMLTAHGMTVELAVQKMKVIQGWLPSEAIDAVASLDGVTAVTLPCYAMTNAGDVVTAGDDIQNSAELRNLLAVDGTGVKVGVISNGIEHWRDMRASGNLPQNITYEDLGDGDEGTAMLEIVHDVAPGAELYFAPADTTATMVSAIEYLTGEGVDVIVDDLTFYISGSAAATEPYFTDGAVANAAEDAVSEGVTYVTCAGNWQRAFDWYVYGGVKSHWQGDFVDGGGGYQDFDPTANVDQGNALYVADGHSIYVVLQWSDPWPGSANNYDLYLYNEGLTAYYASSTLPQSGTQYPWEFVTWQNTTGSGKWVNLVIRKLSGSARELELFVYGTAATGLEYTTGDTLASQQAVEAVITAGAIDAGDSGNDDVEAFSSHGPSTIYTNFSTQTSISRNSLDVCGIDGVQTKIGSTGHFGNPFYGTSAAAPHVAGLCALLLEYSPTLTPAGIHSLLCENAVDIVDAGYDNVSGYGRADALAIVTTAAGTPDLVAGSDTGRSDSDNITKLDNHDGNSTLQFTVGSTVDGATVVLLAGETEIGSGTGNGGTITITTNGSFDLADGNHDITSRQTVDGKLPSALSNALTITVDTVAPVVTVASRLTRAATPDVWGGIDDPGAEVDATVNGYQYEATNGGDYWIVTATSGTFSEGKYDVEAVATDAAGNVGSDNSDDELWWTLGDVNGDGLISQPELDAVLLRWGDYVTAGSAGDPNGDGFVGQADLDYALLNWGESGAPDDEAPGGESAMGGGSEMAAGGEGGMLESVTASVTIDSFVTPETTDTYPGGTSIPADTYVTNDIVLTTETDWLSAQLILEADSAGDVFQHPQGSVISPNPFVFQYYPALAYDTYLSNGVVGEAVNTHLPPVDLFGGKCSVVFDDQQLLNGWYTLAQDETGELPLARITLSNEATGTWKLLVTAAPEEGPVIVLEGTIVDGELVPDEPE